MQPKLHARLFSRCRTITASLGRFAPLVALSLTLIAFSALAACGGGGNGDDGDNGGASPSTPTTTDTTPSASGATPPPAPADAASATGSGTETIFVVARGFEVFELTLAAGDTVSITYSSLGRSSGGITTGGKFAGDEGAGSAEGDVILTVLNPIEEQVLDEERTDNNTVEFQADIAGTYQLVFSNPYLLQGLEVTVDYTINP